MTTATPANRMDWIDLVKGTSVVLVVLMHASLTLPQVAGDSTAATIYNGAGNLLEPLRMPVFFLVSGMLAAGAVHRGWSANRRRTWGIGYLYVLWTLLLALVTVVILGQGSPLDTFAAMPGTLAVAASGYWYLYALVLFFVIARVTRTFPPILVVGAAAVLNVLRPLSGDALSAVLEPLHPGSLAPTMAVNLVFFLVGVHHKEALGRIVQIASPGAVAVLGAVLLAAGGYRLVTPQLWPHTFLPLSVGWIVWAIMAAHLATGSAAVRRAGAYLGARTLPIYVVQFPVLALVSTSLQGARPELLGNPVVQAVYPLALTALIVGGALALHTYARGNGLLYLFTAPSWALDPIAALRRPSAAALPQQSVPSSGASTAGGRERVAAAV
jgi:fucose 4-O-acetylase-like acetyltransferase